MRKLILLILILPVLIYSQIGWSPLVSGTNRNLYNLYFANVNTGYVIGDTILLKTTNGGVNWFSLTRPGLGSAYIRFFGTDSGFVGGGIDSVYFTSDGGLSWSSTPRGASSIICFSSTSRGNDVRYLGSCYRTTNGGLNWITGGCSSYIYRAPQGIAFTSTDVGYIIGFDNHPANMGASFIYKTTDGGQGYLIVSFAGQSKYATSIFFVNSSTGYVSATHYIVGGSGLLKTIDGGGSFNWVAGETFPFFFSILWFITPEVGYIRIDNSQVRKTTNGGFNWSIEFPDTARINKIFFVDTLTGYAVGNNGKILKTTNGGITFIQPISNEIPNQFSLSQNYPNPFNPSTKIRFTVTSPRPETSSGHPSPQRRGEGGEVKLIVFDVLGREVTTLVNEQLQPDTYEVDWDGSGFSSGIYYYKLVAGEYAETKKMVLMK